MQTAISPMLYTPKDISELLKISRASTYRLLHDESCPFPVISLGPKTIRIPKVEFDEFLHGFVVASAKNLQRPESE